MRMFDLQVLDDGVQVDLKWWNDHLTAAKHTVQLRGRNLDGRIVKSGKAVILRHDLRLNSDLVDADHDALGLLFLCAAWRVGHTRRRSALRFPNVTDAHRPQDRDPFAKIRGTLDYCVKTGKLPAVAGRSWPDTPGVGVSLLATFLWAVGVGVEGGPAQLVDQHGVSTLVHEGWLEDPSVADFTLRRYERYVGLIVAWAEQIGTRPELVEMWLVERWNARLAEARDGSHATPRLF